MLPYSHAVVKPFFLLTPATGQAYRSGGMAAVLDATDCATATVKRGIPKQLAPYIFKPGHERVPGSGRAPGTRNSVNVLLDAAPQLAKSYIRAGVKDRAPAILNDARKWIMPIDSDAPVTVQPLTLIAVLEKRAALLPPAPSASLQLSLPASETPEVT